MRRRLIMLAAGGAGALGLLLVPSASGAGNGDNCPNPASKNPPGQCATKNNNGQKKPPGHNCPNPAGKEPPGQCKKTS